jgi:RNA polymerase sigma-70 factor (ECF subfamily)
VGIRRSDPAALRSVFEELHPGLVRSAEGILGERAAARDVVQDAFVRIWEGRHDLDPDRSLPALLHRTVRNLALNRRRDTRTRNELLSTKFEPLVGSVDRPDEAVHAAGLRSQLESWIAELPPRQREALTLSRFHGLTHDEIARRMDVTARTVNNHLVRALRSLRDRIHAHDPDLLDP